MESETHDDGLSLATERAALDHAATKSGERRDRTRKALKEAMQPLLSSGHKALEAEIDLARRLAGHCERFVAASEQHLTDYKTLALFDARQSVARLERELAAKGGDA